VNQASREFPNTAQDNRNRVSSGQQWQRETQHNRLQLATMDACTCPAREEKSISPLFFFSGKEGCANRGRARTPYCSCGSSRHDV